MSNIVFGEEFFAPAATDLVDNLIGRYRNSRAKIEALAEVVNGPDAAPYLSYFFEGDREGRERFSRTASEIFKLDGAIANLNATYWQQAMSLTDVQEYMPAKRRNEWSEQIREQKTPDFEEETVRSTLTELLNSRQQFFGERVDGIFTRLSGDHVTNQPQGFSKRMIIANVMNNYDTINHDTVNYIHDLREVVAKFMGRDKPDWQNTRQMIYASRRQSGEWMTVDGGSMRIRTYNKGTAHFEVHPEMAWRLNGVLASLHPLAIPAEFRQKPKKKLKNFVMMENPLPFSVLNILGEMKQPSLQTWQRDHWSKPVEPVTQNPYSLEFTYGYRGNDKHVLGAVRDVLRAIGGAQLTNEKGAEWWEFEYDPRPVVDHIVTSGLIPDQKSHQFYPTPQSLAERCVELADIQPGNICLEPSAGQGGIADYMPALRTVCIEISPLHCKILESKGFKTIKADFLQWVAPTTPKFDRIVMNPPFSEGRAQAHILAASECLKTEGRMVAVLPAGMRGKDVLSGFNLEWSEIIDNEFSGTSISVVILTATKRA
ncbi:DUF4942 domain-containing protein [Enterobacteriaceae bacterium ML5]|nr:DUF4942 domain-containing protein [Enterobacteriaceae bacterium ML5]